MRALFIVMVCISISIILVLPLLPFYHEVFMVVSLSASATVNQSVTTSASSLFPLVSASPSQVPLPLQSSPSSSLQFNISATETEFDAFGIAKIYPTKEGGREWFINMSDPKSSPNFSITDNANLSHLSDGSWRINSSHVRMVINTSDDQTEWKNTEITGFVRLAYLNDSQLDSIRDISNSSFFSNTPISLDTPDDEEPQDLVFISRSGRHSSEVPCEGTAYNGDLHTDGSVGWKKEIWHTGRYTEERARHTVTEPLLGKWIGWKVVVYNIKIGNDSTAVKLESYLDDSNTENNNWAKVTELIDSGGWYANTNNSEFFRAGCDKVKDHIITEGAPFIIFRTDNLLLDFKNLSIREIQPPLNVNLTNILSL
jgi:hypothetical protein